MFSVDFRSSFYFSIPIFIVAVSVRLFNRSLKTGCPQTGCFLYGSVRFHRGALRETFLEMLNYTYPFVTSVHITRSIDHAGVYVFAVMWSVFNRLPLVFFIFAFLFCSVLVVQYLYDYLTGYQKKTSYSGWFCFCILFCDFV